MSGARARLVVFASGRGTNLQALMDACRDGRLAADIVAVVSHTASAVALERAKKVGIPATFVAPPKRSGDRDAWDAALADRILAMMPDAIVLAGWMRILGPAFLDRFPGRVVNLHPAAPGELPGLDAIERAFEEGPGGGGRRAETGVMVHKVVPEVDAGPTVVWERVPILADDTLDALEARIHAVEHRLIVQGVGALLGELGFPQPN